jgi:hypothetical protein
LDSILNPKIHLLQLQRKEQEDDSPITNSSSGVNRVIVTSARAEIKSMSPDKEEQETENQQFTSSPIARERLITPFTR